MAERVTSSGARDLDFIATNPAMDAYEHGQKIARDAQAADLAAEAQQQKNVEARAGMGTRLRTIDAQADTARAGADVAVATVPAHISQANSAATTAASGARVATGTEGYKIDDARQGNRLQRANADVAEQTAPDKVQQSRDTTRSGTANADVTVATAPNKIKDAGNTTRLGTVNADIATATQPDKIEQQGPIATRQAKATAANSEMAVFTKQLELLNSGQTEAALELARQNNHTIPKEVIENAEVRAAITRAAKHAAEAYPNRPKDQMTFIKGFIEDMAQRKQAGQSANDPTAPYNVPGAPEPQEDTTRSFYEWRDGVGPDPNDPTKMVPGRWKQDRYGGTEEFTPGVSGSSGSGGRGGAGHDPAAVATAKWLVDKGVARNEQEAWTMVSTSKSNPAGIRAQVFNAALRASFNNVEKAKQAVAEFDKMNAASPPTATPPATAAPRIAPPPGLQGAGTAAAPFQATTQDHVNWFKATAPAGAVIVIDGKKYTK